ncbi:HAD family hydrolase [Rhodoferax sp.]|uniref:HAD family hydrolase n=1 Tax=Rhodoferax sp. TaxID=50421 RepID=UPI00284333AF|nr:HAD family hydrolase [Rhodoferax sp.]MDR3370768.1 HAD family hydrolase [Rhodoferax sp.]
MKKHKTSATAPPLSIALISIHGLIRGHDLELGRDADTGGQTKYVVELANALGERDDVAKVVLLTRRVVDDQVSPDYAVLVEPLSAKASIVRLECGAPGYMRKELLWDSLDSFSDNVLAYFKKPGNMPDIIHSHYADAGYVGARLSHQLGIPLVHTGHSLGRNKRKQLLASGVKRSEIESTYNISRRVEAEETTLGAAERVITSTQQEIEQQYGSYDYYQPQAMRVIPPGTDLKAFYPPREGEDDHGMADELAKFLKEPGKPIILALSRPDPKKNIVSLIEAYGESPKLQRVANLVIIAGNRDDIQDIAGVSKTVLNEILLAIDKYDLYGKVAYPKHHKASQVPSLYRMATRSGGVFVNPALTEPFGLTLIEAAACGLPLVATEDGGPIEIIKNCNNGYLIDPLNKPAMAEKLLATLTRKRDWKRFSANGMAGVCHFYSWPAHVETYLKVIRPLVDKTEPVVKLALTRRPNLFRRRALFSSLDLNLTGDRASLAELLKLIYSQRKTFIFGIATGRHLDDALAVLRQHDIPEPDILITNQGTQIHYAPDLTRDTAWEQHIDHHWNPQEIRTLLTDIAGLRIQPKNSQSAFKISYFIDPTTADVTEIRQILLRNDQAVNLVFSFGHFLDILPARASKGLALRWCADQFGFPLENTLVAGVTRADEDMLRGNPMGVVVANQYPPELSELCDADKIYFSKNKYAAGILEAIDHYQFLTVNKGKTT